MQTEHAELDVVALDDSTLVAIEVKSGWTIGESSRRPAEHLKRNVLQRQRRAARGLARGRSYRVDLIEICLRAEGEPQVEHWVDVRPQA